MTTFQKLVGGFYLISLVLTAYISYSSGITSGKEELAAIATNSCNAFVKETVLPYCDSYYKSEFTKIAQTMRCPVNQESFLDWRIKQNTDLLLQQLTQPNTRLDLPPSNF